MKKALGNAIGFLGRMSSQFTLIIGVVYLYYHHPKLNLKYESCSFEDEPGAKWVDCNQEWASNFGLPALPNMTTLFVGLFGIFMYRPVLLQVQGFPKNFVQYGIFLFVQGFFANFGYCGKLGVVNGFFSIFVAVLAFIAQVTGLEADRMLKIKGHKVVDCVADEQDVSRSLSEAAIKDYYPWTIMSVFFCPILGGMGVYESYQVKNLKKAKELDGARLASQNAAKWGLWAIMVGMVLIGSLTIIGVTNLPPAVVASADDDDEDQYGYGDGDDDDGDGDDADGDGDGDADDAADTERRLREFLGAKTVMAADVFGQ